MLSVKFRDIQGFHQCEKSSLFYGLDGELPEGKPSAFPPGLRFELSPFDTSGAGSPPCWSLSQKSPTIEVPSSVAVKSAAKAAVELMLSGASPMCNTGHKFTSHGASITIFTQAVDVANLVARHYFPDFNPFDESALDRFEDLGPVKLFGKLLKGPCGISLRTEPRIGGSYVSVELSGEAFETYGMAAFARVLADVEDAGYRWHLTRLDNAWDYCHFTPKMVFDEIHAGNLRSLAQRDTLEFHSTPFGESKGDTCNLGKRGSADFLRVYNKRGFTRLEHECRGNRAKWLGYQLVHTPLGRWHEVAMGNLRDFFNLVKVKPGENVTRAEQAGKFVPFWKKFIGDSERCNVKLSDPAGLKKAAEISVGKLKAACKRVGRTVAMLREILPPAIYDRWLCMCGSSLKPVHLVKVESHTTCLNEYRETFSLTDDEVFADLLKDEWRSALRGTNQTALGAQLSTA